MRTTIIDNDEQPLRGIGTRKTNVGPLPADGGAAVAMYTTTTRRHECARPLPPPSTGNENLKVVFENIAAARLYTWWCARRTRVRYASVWQVPTLLLWFNELQARENGDYNFYVLRYRNYTQFPFTHIYIWVFNITGIILLWCIFRYSICSIFARSTAAL